MKSLFCFLVLYLAGTSSQLQEKCQPRDFGHGSTVCVCNSSYCDQIPQPEVLSDLKYYKYTSNKAGLRFDKEIGNFEDGNNDQNDENVIEINVNEVRQTILGWGGAFTDSAGINLKSLDEKAQEKLLEAYFSKNGIGYSLCRVPMGGTDFSTRGYSYDDGEVDEKLINWKLAQEDFDYKIPYIKKALNLTDSNLNLFTSTWTAPKWMKSNGEYSGVGSLIDTYYQTWADYFVKFLDAYEEEGITFWGITTGNEPSLALIPLEPINSVGWTPADKGKWIENNLGPTIRSSNHSEIKIMTLDDQRLFLPWFIEQELVNETARNYIDGIAVHWYMDDYLPAVLLSETHEKFPEKFILGTEACRGDKPIGKGVILGSWERSEDYSKSIIEDMSNWMSGWVDWNMALNLTGGPTYIDNIVDSPIIVNASSGEFYKQPMFYSMGHFSKFVPRDSVHVFSSELDIEKVSSVAFKRPDNGTVLVALNRRDDPVSVKIVDAVKNISTKLYLSERSLTTILYW